MLAKNDYLIEEFCENPNYIIQEDGRIFSRYGKYGHGCDEPVEIGRIRHQKGKHYKSVAVRVGDKIKNLAVHRIVWLKFKGSLDSNLTINHIDGDGTNNSITNLELVSQAANNLHAYRVTGRAPVLGNAKITPVHAEIIRVLGKAGIKYSHICDVFGVCASTVSYVVNDKTWKVGS